MVTGKNQRYDFSTLIAKIQHRTVHKITLSPAVIAAQNR